MKKKKLSNYEKYLDYVNNFLTVAAFASYYSMTEKTAFDLIEAQRERNYDG